MKSLFLSIALFLSFNYAEANCTQNEAQFIAYVTQVQVLKDNTCHYSVSFTEKNTLFNSHILCPLFIETVNDLGITEEKKSNLECLYSVGEMISGILFQSTVSNDQRVFLE